MSAIPTIPLNDGTAIPQLGFGTWQIRPEDAVAAVADALAAGYRHIDTAQMYGNEREVGEAVRRSGLGRSEVWITSKLNNGFHRPADARRAFDATLAALGTDHVDLFLIHWPLPTLYSGDYVSTWNTLVEFAREGRARSVGVSNFQPEHLDRLAAETDLVPSVNQIEAHPYFLNDAARDAGHARGTATEAWSPLAQGRVLTDPEVARVAHALGRTPAQTVLRWHVQRGDVVFPKSLHADRMRANAALFDFDLDADDMAALSALDRGAAGRVGPDPDTFDYVPG